MKVLITGASGAVGKAVSDVLLARGDDVVALSRDPERSRRENARVTWHGWNPTLERPPAAALDNVDGVINLLGEKINQRWTDAAKKRIHESRETGTKNLVEALVSAERKPRVLVSQSAVGYYGDTGEKVIDESAAPGDRFDSQVCVAWEAAARGVEGSGIRLAITRTGLVLDKDHGLLKELLVPFRLGVGGPLAGGGFYMPWISLDDEIGLLLWALDTEGVSGVYNATAPNPVTNRELSKALGRAIGRPAIVPVPKLAVVARLGREMGDAATTGQRAVPRRALDEGYPFRHADIDSGLAAALA